MSGDERSLHDLWTALSRVTRRLDDLAAGVARLAAAEAVPSGEPLDEPTRARLAGLESVLAVGPHLGRQVALLLAVDRVIHQAGADCAALFLPNAEGGLQSEAQRGFHLGPLRLATDEGLVGRAFGEGETIRGVPAHQAVDRLLREHDILQALAIPVRAPAGPVVAVLFAGRRRPAAFGDEALATLRLLAERVGLTLATASPALEPPPDLLELARELDLDRAAARVARVLAARLGAERAVVLLPEGAGIRPVADLDGPRRSGALSPVPEAVAATLRGAPSGVLGPHEPEPAVDVLVGSQFRAVIPIAIDDQVVAVLVAGGPRPLPTAALGGLLPLAGAALRNARLLAETTAGLEDRRAAGRQAPSPPPVRDFANLLAVILARVGLARERIGDPALAAELGVAEEAAWRAVEAVRSLLGFAPGERDTPRVPLDLGAVIREAVEDARRQWASRPGSPPVVTLDLVPLPPIRGCADDLREALRHLLDNAAEAVSPGGAITVRTRWDGREHVDLLVEDAGTGMDERVRARALEPFFSTRGPGRLGLGLPVVQAIVAHHAGTLDLVSVPEAGTTVRLGFPTAGAAARVFGGAAGRAAVARVLVVEDDAAVREALATALAHDVRAVLSAADGPEALEIVRREAIDVVLADLDLPALSGIEVARQVKRIQPQARVVLVTAWPGRLDDATLAEAGIDRVIDKPVGVEEVLSVLDAVLGRRPVVRP